MTYLNSIVPDHWVTRAVAESFRQRAENAENKLGLPPALRIRNHRAENGVFMPEDIRRGYSQLAHAHHIWIRAIEDGKATLISQQSMSALATQMGIQHAAVNVHVFSHGSVVSWPMGIVVRIQDATEFLLRWNPNLLDYKRSLVYDNDDH